MGMPFFTPGEEILVARTPDDACAAIETSPFELTRIANAARERTLAPDFYVQMPDQKISRQEFLDMISSRPKGGRLVRFDASVLTVEPSTDGWVAVIQEKLEYERADGKGKVYAYWITRDNWKKAGDRWVVTYSEAIGNEAWRDGAKPPFRDW